MSPETIVGDKEGRGESDYWSLGVILYLIYTRSLPFDSKDDNTEKIMDNIVEYNINWDKLKNTNIEPDLFDLVKGLLAQDPMDRICCLSDIQEHSYFKGKLYFPYFTEYSLKSLEFT